MRSSGGSTPLGLVIGAAIGALIGLALVKLSPWFIVAGAVVGGLFGVIIATSDRSARRGYSSIDGDDVVNAGCMAAGCLGDALSWGSCLGCGTLMFSVTGLVVVSLLHLR